MWTDAERDHRYQEQAREARVLQTLGRLGALGGHISQMQIQIGRGCRVLFKSLMTVGFRSTRTL